MSVRALYERAAEHKTIIWPAIDEGYWEGDRAARQLAGYFRNGKVKWAAGADMGALLDYIAAYNRGRPANGRLHLEITAKAADSLRQKMEAAMCGESPLECDGDGPDQIAGLRLRINCSAVCMQYLVKEGGGVLEIHSGIISRPTVYVFGDPFEDIADALERMGCRTPGADMRAFEQLNA